MKLIRQERLQLIQGENAQFYEIDLCEVGPEKFVVNFRYHRGSSLVNEGTNTPVAVTEADAIRVFERLVRSQRDKGYRTADENVAASESLPGEDEKSVLDPLRQSVLSRVMEGHSSKSDWKISRAVWSCGVLKISQAEPYLIALLGTGDSMLDYSIAWALGQCGTSACAKELEAIEGDGESPSAVRRIAGYALREVATAQQREELIAKCIRQLPEELKDLAQQGPCEQFQVAFSEVLNRSDANTSVVLEMAYYIDNEHVRPAVINVLRELPLKPNHFQRIRHIFKAAEMRRDADLFGLLGWRFATTFGNFRMGPRWYYPRREIPTLGEDATQAYSAQTRVYLCKRIWRTLRKLGEGDSSDYCKMAAGVLKQFSDADGSTPREVRWYRWDSKSNRGEWVTSNYDRFSRFLAFNGILYTNSSRYQLDPAGNQFRCAVNYQPGQPAPEGREEAFPKLWDQAPEVVVDLLLASQCEPVHTFGIGVLRANAAFQDLITIEALSALLGVKYRITTQFTFDVVVKRFDIANPDATLLLALANCDLDAARDQAYQWIHECRERLVEQTDLWAKLIVSRQDSTRRFIRDELPNLLLGTEATQVVIGKVLAFLTSVQTDVIETDSNESVESEIARDATETLLIAFPDHLKVIGVDIIRDLARHPMMELQRFAGELILRHSELASHPPTDILNMLLASEHEASRNVAVRIIGQLPESVLSESIDLLFDLARHEREDIRQLIRPAISKTAQGNSEFAREISHRFIEALLIPGAPEGVPSHTALVLREDLRDYLSEVTQETVWKLLYSRSAPAQEVGGMLLASNVDSSSLSVEEIARLCHHKVLSVRESARTMCQQNLERFQAEPENAALMIDSAWEDTRQFAFAFFEDNFSSEDALSPEVLISICDSVRPDVQLFGRGMITRLFHDEHGEDYLLKLSEHPSAGMQLFVSNLLDQYANEPEVLRELSLFFITVLSRVNKGRVAKTRTFVLLEREALKNEDSARIVAEILGRLSATTAIMDRGKMVEMMLQIQGAYPGIKLPLIVQPLEVRGGV